MIGKTSSHALRASIALNVLALGLLAYFMYHYHTFTRVRDRLANLNSPAATLDSDEVSYLTRETLFEQLPAQGHPIVFLGDSQTANCEWGELFPGAINRGIGGDTSAGLAKRISAVTRLEPRAVFLLVGANDFARGVPPQETATNIRTAVAKLRESTPATPIYIQSLTPTWKAERNQFTKEVNRLLQPMADGKMVFYLDFYDSFLQSQFLKSDYSYDGLHLNGFGFIAWKRLLEPYVAALSTSKTPWQYLSGHPGAER